MVLRLSLLFAVLFALWGAVAPGHMTAAASEWLSFTISRFGWFYLLSVFGFLLFALYLAFGRFGHIRLGKEDEEPEFSRLSWFSMLFSAGMGIGLVFWGVAEPLSHFATPASAATAPESAEAARLAMRHAFFHWGLHPWAVYSLTALALAYFKFNRGQKGLISAAFRPLLGDRVDGPIGVAIDVLAVLATVFGVATTLGFGTLQIESGLEMLFGVTPSATLTVAIVVIATALFLLSSLTGLSRGIKWLSNLNIVLAMLLFLAVVILGPTGFIFDTFTTTLGDYLGNLTSTSLRMSPFTQGTWMANWTLFYWAWWVTWAPFVGMFIARVSRGRTVREFIVGVLLVPALASFVWFSAFGGTALDLQLFGGADLVSAVKADVSTALYVMFEQLPGGRFLSLLAMTLVIIFFVTSADSATFVLGMFTSGGSLNPSHRVKLIWGVLLAAIALVLLQSGGLKALQAVLIVSALPFMLIMIGMAVSLYRALSEEEHDSRLRQIRRLRQLEALEKRLPD
ncbi:glycine betaine uptake BCCT transporter [Chromobacterium violaceum]|uniref:High-affinity choline transport protein n=2 Tax=Chromobacterium violaceum TaxID=536 RepID=Q7NQ38_CHRVO|nr:BCCT family transporter [Chromobacterium violaceum]AAQ61962.1 high-affinity choline transport protein [Chromobacterium violaceum ATCC 12472]MBP4046933.1 BCCT family transporter [Chromobacterium violaceum]MBX9266936.1 BCCT family transporter [Chromobacterium violaceum]QIY79655.1 BCCT family transporter [Chromobacterium violaceum]SUX40825.1 Glycine betaine transporter BetP [Chromobacterium violaceum]